MSSTHILIWDWDGTLVDSLTYKYEGIWEEVFLDEPEKISAVQNFIKTPEGKGVNRYGLIEHTLLNTGSSDLSKLNFYADRYSLLSKNQVERSDFLLPGVQGMLERLYTSGYKMYIVSGGGTDEDLKNMATKIKIGHYFQDIFGFGNIGTPLASFGKRENFDRIMTIEQNFKPSNYVIIGDGESDRKFADIVGASFIGITNEWNGWVASSAKIITSVLDVEKLLHS